MRITYKITLEVIDNLKELIDYEIAQDARFTNDIIEEKLNNLEEDIHHQINCEVANACIYYADCFDIVKELGVTDCDDLNKELGTISDICSLAMYSLSNEVYERFESDIYDSVTLYYGSLRTNEQIEF